MSSIPDELTRFVRETLAQGIPRPEIDAVLRRAGWTAAQVRAALGAFDAAAFPVPVPRPRPSVDARDAFVYLLMFATLYITAYHTGSLLFDIINAALPDPAESGNIAQYRRASIRWSVASLLVGFPVFLFMSRLAARDVAADPNKRQSNVRRWLTYLTLFLAATAVIGDVITLIYRVLGGELTGRFLLKAAVIAAIAGTVFWYYMTDINRGERDLLPGA